jgi:transposase
MGHAAFNSVYTGGSVTIRKFDMLPRCVKDVLEEALFACRRDLLTTLDVVFLDTTSLHFEGAGGQTLGRRGFSKDHRPDLNQMILAVLLDSDGRPVCTEMWPGNTADVGSLIPVIDRLQRRFRINRVCVVAARGMISAETIAELRPSTQRRAPRARPQGRRR